MFMNRFIFFVMDCRVGVSEGSHKVLSRAYGTSRINLAALSHPARVMMRTKGVAMISRTFERLFSTNILSAVAAVSIGLLCVRCAQANDVLSLAEPFYEAFADAPSSEASRSIVGASIIGLRLDGPAHLFDPQAIRILFGDGLPKPDLLCARFLSRDGRYFARGQYKVVGVGDPAPRLDFQTHYRRQLAGYLTTDFGMFAVAGKSCDDPRGSLLFVVDNGGPEDVHQLVVQIRAGDARMYGQLGRDNVAVGPAVLCRRPAEGPTVGYTVECSLPLPAPFLAGRYQLSIAEIGTGGERVTTTYSVVLATIGRDAPK
jgi:hypothetical protein